MRDLPPALMEYRQIMDEEDFRDFLIDLIMTFKDVTPHHIKELKVAFVGKDQEAFKRAAHSLKSSGRTFQLTHFTALATELEERGCLEDPQVVDNLIQSCELEFFKTIPILDGFLEEM
jgi:HPt (histidine-containing phosphotransfer) domain-containing protein